jgi:uracil-DNA glycosylase family 4
MDAPVWKDLNTQITSCRQCSRLVSFREEIGTRKKPCFMNQTYWSKPLTGIGDRNGWLLVLGLAPAAHGGNRTGRIFTGSPSADFLMRALWEAGFANQPESETADDVPQLRDVYLTNLVRCAPPANRPTPQETVCCRPYLLDELKLLKNIRVVIPLGAFAFKGYVAALRNTETIDSSIPFQFRHGAVYSTHSAGPLVICCYHPSQQNTVTGRLTAQMMRHVFSRAASLIR